MACHKCGMTNHLQKDCRASADKVKAYAQKKKGLHKLESDQEQDLGFMCPLYAAGNQAGNARQDGSDRQIRFRVDSGACTTVVPVEHPAARGYKTWDDEKSGHVYRTAGKSGVKDHGKRILQTKARDGPGGKPVRLRTRAANVSIPLMSVKDMTRSGQTVVFDETGSFTFNKATGVKTMFEDKTSGWDVVLDIEAPDTANKVAQQVLAQLHALKAEKTAENALQSQVVTPAGACMAIASPQDMGGSHNMGPFMRQRLGRA